MKNILITGSHRSGTTWTGRVLSTAKGMRYVHEPFNIHIKRKKPLTTPFKYVFQYLNEYETSKLNEEAKYYLFNFYKTNFSITYKRFINLRSYDEFKTFVKDFKSRKLNKYTVFKDPMAIMSAEWLYVNFNVDVIVLIRHPAAFIASLKIKNWYFDFNNILLQEELVNKHFIEYKDEIKNLMNKDKNIIEQGILLWNIIHKVILNYNNKYNKEWYFIRHEDLSKDPIKEFQKMFNFLELEFDKRVKSYIVETTQSQISNEVIFNSSKIEDVNRNSSENIKTWKKRLTNEEIVKIKLGTEKIWKQLYSESDW